MGRESRITRVRPWHRERCITLALAFTEMFVCVLFFNPALFCLDFLGYSRRFAPPPRLYTASRTFRTFRPTLLESRLISSSNRFGFRKSRLFFGNNAAIITRTINKIVPYRVVHLKTEKISRILFVKHPLFFRGCVKLGYLSFCTPCNDT